MRSPRTVSYCHLRPVWLYQVFHVTSQMALLTEKKKVGTFNPFYRTRRPLGRVHTSAHLKHNNTYLLMAFCNQRVCILALVIPACKARIFSTQHIIMGALSGSVFFHIIT
jgi:hypothetical protein